MKIQYKLQIAFITTSIIIAASIISISYFSMVSHFEQQEGNRLKANVRHSARIIDNFMFARVADFNVLSNNPLFSRSSNEIISQYLLRVVNQYPFYENLFFVNKNGIVLSSSDQKFIGVNILQLEPDIEDEFSKTINGGHEDVYVSDISKVSQKEIDEDSPLDIELLSDVIDLEENVVGVLVGFVNIQIIRELILDIDDKIFDNEYTYLVNNQGIVLISGNKETKILQQHPDLLMNELQQKVETGETGFYIYENSKDIKVISGYADLSEYGTEGVGNWSLITTAPYSEVMKPIYQMMYKVLFTFLLILLVILVLVVLFSRAFSKRIVDLKQAVTNFGINGKPIDLKGRNKDEIGSLYESFNAMTENLHDLSNKRNIAEHKLIEAKEKAEESKNKFKTLFDKSPVSIWEQDFSETLALLNKKKAGIDDIETYLNENPAFVIECVSKIKISNVNDITLELIGVKNLEELTSHLKKSNTKKGINELKNELISIALGKKDYFGETEFIRTDGTILHTIIKSTMIDDNGKNIASIINITERKKAEEDIMSLNTAIGKSINEVYIFGAESFKFYYANSRALENTGYALEELLSMTPVDIKPEYSLKEFNKLLIPLKNEGIRHLQFKTIHRRKDKTTYPVEINLSKFKVNNKSRYLALIIDITKRKEEEKELLKAKEKAEENEEKLNLALQGSDAGLWSWNIKTGEDFLDERWCGIFGYKQREIKQVASSWENMIHPDDEEKVMEVVKKHIEDEKNQYNLEYRMRCKNGDWKWIHAMGKIVKRDMEGKPERMTGIIIDIDIHKHAEAELLKAKEKAEESDQLKTEFINNMSHEIRTPMNGIMGFSDMLSQNDISDEKRANFIKIIQSSGQQLLNVIDDILEISRLGTKQVKVIESDVCLNDVLLELFSTFDIKAKVQKTPLYLKKALSDQQSTIRTDKTKLNKVLSNLLENALKFTNHGFIEFGYQLKNDNIELYVKDTGVGIEKSKHELIFERFSQAEKELSKNVGGLGLGLSIAKENAELLGGSIQLESKEGEGSTFFITIPYKPVYKVNDTEKAKTVAKYTILIAEDEEINQLYLETLLKDVIGLDCKIIHVTNGKDAIEACKENNTIDLVLMDLKMPILNGFEATKLIKKLRPNLPIVAQTAYSTLQEKEQAILVGCDDFISKPINQESFKNILDKYLE